MSETATDNGIYQSAFMVELLRQIKAHDQYGTHDGWSAERLLEPFFRKREQAAAGCTVDRAALLRVTTFYQALAVLIEGECGQMASLVVNINDEGFGRVLMDEAIRRAWAKPIERFWVHTCTFDSPLALPFYIRSGFTPYLRMVEVHDDPRLLGKLAREASPQVPILG